MKNNDMKYLSKRKIIIESRMKESSSEGRFLLHMNEEKMINE
jgi:hypothetical protein